ncbi:MAG: hypothetical protein IPO23_01200 [Flavobacterium sp.]|nr:hypothetical protein [Flavobacterium sp.]
MAAPAILVGAIESVFTVTGKLAEIIPLPQAFVPCTVMFPDTADVLKSTVIAFELLPDVIVAPEGKVQV